MNLSKKQDEIVKAQVGNAIQVLASAGSGKTRVLTERVRYILDQEKHGGVIAITFTNKAANEMKDRLSLSEEFEERTWIATIHSVAQKIVEKYSHTIGLPSQLNIYEREEDRMEVFLQSLRFAGIDIDEYLSISNRKTLKDREKNLKNYFNFISKIKREMLFERDIRDLKNGHSIWKIYSDYQEALLESGGIDFDDILVYAHSILTTHEWVAEIYRAKYAHICVDEAQDLNRAQYEFVKALCGDVIKSVMFVGDPNQMIYGFNSSSNEFLCKEFLSDFSPIQFELTENFRSSRAVIQAANAIKHDSQEEAKYALEGTVKIREFADEEKEADAIVDSITKLLEMEYHDEIEGKITEEKMVVIARNRYVFKFLEIALKNKNIPFFMMKGDRHSGFSSKLGQVLDYAIRIRINPKDWVNGKKLCQLLKVKEPKTWDNTLLCHLQEQVALLDNESSIISKLLDLIQQLNVDQPKTLKFVHTLKEELKNNYLGIKNPSIEEVEEFKDSLYELEEFEELWVSFKERSLGASLTAFRNAMSLGQLIEESAGNGLALSSVHTMKGLEKDIVFIMGMCEGVFPDYRARTEKEIYEEQNNAFVAVTRARRWLFVSYPKSRIMPWGDPRVHEKSRFLNGIKNQNPFIM